MSNLILALILCACGVLLIWSYGESMRGLDYFNRNNKFITKIALIGFDFILAGINFAKFLGW